MIAWLLAVAILAGSSAMAGSELELPPIERAVLPNGMVVLVGESRELPIVQLAMLVGVGSAHDPAEDLGLAALTANSLMRGAGPYDAPALAREIEGLGGRLGASAGTDATVVAGEFLREDLARGLELLRLVVREPRFARDEVRRARDEQSAAIAEAMEDPQSVIERCFAAALYGRHPYGRSLYGTRDGVGDIGHRDVRRFHDRWYRPGQTILTVVGDVDADRVRTLVQDGFAGWESGRVAPVQPPAPEPLGRRRVVLVDQPDATQTQIRIGGIAMARRDPDLLPAQVANTVLGGGFSSVLIEELRVKRSLTYGAWSGFVPRLVGGDFRLGTFTKTATTAETLRLALELLDRFRRKGPPAEGLEKAKAYLRGQFPLRLETVEAVAGRLAEIEFYGLPKDELTTYRRRVAAVDPAEAARVLARWLPPDDGLAIVVLGQAPTIRGPLEQLLGSITVVPAAACEDAQGALAPTLG